MKPSQLQSDNPFRDPFRSSNRGQNPNWEQLCNQLQEQKNFYKQQYQKLYQSYCQKKEKIKQYKQYKRYIKELEDKIRVLEHKLKENQRIDPAKRQVVQIQNLENQVEYKLKKQNQKLTEKLIQKNQQLEQVYVKLQQELKRSELKNISEKQSLPINILKESVMNNLERNFEGLKRQSVQNFHQLQTKKMFINNIEHYPVPSPVTQIIHPQNRIIAIEPFNIHPQYHILPHHNLPLVRTHLPQNIQIPVSQSPQLQEMVSESSPSKQAQQLDKQSGLVAPSAAVRFCPITPYRK